MIVCVPIRSGAHSGSIVATSVSSYSSRSSRDTRRILIEPPYRNGAMLEALVASCQPGTLVCVATDLSLPTETVRTQTAAKWKAQLAAGKAPDFHKKPTVFLFLAQ